MFLQKWNQCALKFHSFWIHKIKIHSLFSDVIGLCCSALLVLHMYKCTWWGRRLLTTECCKVKKSIFFSFSRYYVLCTIKYNITYRWSRVECGMIMVREVAILVAFRLGKSFSSLMIQMKFLMKMLGIDKQ